MSNPTPEEVDRMTFEEVAHSGFTGTDSSGRVYKDGMFQSGETVGRQSMQFDAGPKKEPDPKPARLVLRISVCHQSPDEQPVEFGNPCVRQLETFEQPYGPRKLKATVTWQPLGLGWLKDNGVGMLVIRNDGAETLEVRCQDPSIQPSDLGNPHWLIFPGELLPASPADAGRVLVRSRKDECKYSLFLIPR
jgi:hypothetical protein